MSGRRHRMSYSPDLPSRAGIERLDPRDGHHARRAGGALCTGPTCSTPSRPATADGAGDRVAGRGDGVRGRDDRQHRVPGHRALLSRRVDRVVVVGPERLQHRVRRVPDRGGPVGGPGRPAARVHRRASSCSRSPPRCARSPGPPARSPLSRAAGARRRDARPLLAGAGAGRVPARSPPARRRAAVGRRRGGRGARPVARRAPGGRRQLAAGVPRQPARSAWPPSCSPAATSWRAGLRDGAACPT